MDEERDKDILSPSFSSRAISKECLNIRRLEVTILWMVLLSSPTFHFLPRCRRTHHRRRYLIIWILWSGTLLLHLHFHQFINLKKTMQYVWWYYDVPFPPRIMQKVQQNMKRNYQRVKTGLCRILCKLRNCGVEEELG